MKSPIPTAMTKTFLSDKKFATEFKEGDRIDISPDSWGVMDKMAKYLDRNGGTGLAIDYGQDYIQGDTLRVCTLFFVYREKKMYTDRLEFRLLKIIKSFILCVIQVLQI